MKLLIVALFTVLTVSAYAEEQAAYWDGMKYVKLTMETPPDNANWEIDWSKVVPVDEMPGFWEGRDLKPFFTGNFRLRGRITNGEIVVPHTHPYQTGLFMSYPTGGTGLCGGTVISALTVMTAAHCPEDSTSTQVVFGAHQINTVEPNQQRITVQASGYRIHEAYSRQTLHNDIALLRLPSPVTLNQFIQPTVLPVDFAGSTFAGELATVSGWGRTSGTLPGTSTHLRSTTNNIVTNAACQAVFGGTIIASTICMATTGGRSACNGDSGGPLTVQAGGQTIQVGVASFVASAGCEAGHPGGFARVTSHLAWIALNRLD